MATTSAIKTNLPTFKLVFIYQSVKKIMSYKHQYTYVFNLQRITFSYTPEEAMFVELAKECVTVLEKTEHSSP